MMRKRLLAVLKSGFKQLALIVASLIAIFSTVRMEAYRGPENPAEGAHVFYGYPIAFKECAAGWAWCQWHYTFWTDVAMAYALLALIFCVDWRHVRQAITKGRVSK
jgi:hypothetical protein